MLILILLITSNALTIRKDKSILFSRTSVRIKPITDVILLNNLFMLPSESYISIYNNLLIINNKSFVTQIFVINVTLLSIFINTHNNSKVLLYFFFLALTEKIILRLLYYIVIVALYPNYSLLLLPSMISYLFSINMNIIPPLEQK